MNNAKNIPLSYQIINELVTPNARILDLGCGNGDLLHLLIEEKQAHGTGIEIDEQSIYKCMEKGLTVSHGDIDSGLSDYSDKRFDYVILNESLQQVLHPEQVIVDALRVGKKVIVGIPNFCHYAARIQLVLGRVPVTKELPYQWYDTPNLRFLSLQDFRVFCKVKGIRIECERALSGNQEVKMFKNLFGRNGIFLLSK